MSDFRSPENKDNKQLLIKLDVAELSPSQIRLIKSINTLLVQVLTAPDETEYFEGSAEFLRTCAGAIKQSNFTETLKGKDGIPYADQALEFSLDSISEDISGAKLVNFDN
jgi:hypothetical protein